MVELSEKTETLRKLYRFQSMAGRTTLLMDSAIF